jgi:hypothetical protein
MVRRLLVLFCGKFMTPATSSWPPQPVPICMLLLAIGAVYCFAQSFFKNQYE